MTDEANSVEVQHPVRVKPAGWSIEWWSIYRLKWAGQTSTEIAEKFSKQRGWVETRVRAIRNEHGEDWIPDAATQHRILMEKDATHSMVQSRRQRESEGVRRLLRSKAASAAAEDLKLLADQVVEVVGASLEALINDPDRVAKLEISELRTLMTIMAEAYEAAAKLQPQGQGAPFPGGGGVDLGQLAMAGGDEKSAHVWEAVNLIHARLSQDVAAEVDAEVAELPAGAPPEGLFQIPTEDHAFESAADER